MTHTAGLADARVLASKPCPGPGPHTTAPTASVSLKAAHRGLRPLLVTAVCSAPSLASFSATLNLGAKRAGAARCRARGLWRCRPGPMRIQTRRETGARTETSAQTQQTQAYGQCGCGYGHEYTHGDTDAGVGTNTSPGRHGAHADADAPVPDDTCGAIAAAPRGTLTFYYST